MDIKSDGAIARQIIAVGYTHYLVDHVENKLKLLNEETDFRKEICLQEFKDLVCNITFITGSNLAGKTHTWISESDGSAEKLRYMIRMDLTFTDK